MRNLGTSLAVPVAVLQHHIRSTLETPADQVLPILMRQLATPSLPHSLQDDLEPIHLLDDPESERRAALTNWKNVGVLPRITDRARVASAKQVKEKLEIGLFAHYSAEHRFRVLHLVKIKLAGINYLGRIVTITR